MVNPCPAICERAFAGQKKSNNRRWSYYYVLLLIIIYFFLGAEISEGKRGKVVSPLASLLASCLTRPEVSVITHRCASIFFCLLFPVLCSHSTDVLVHSNIYLLSSSSWPKILTQASRPTLFDSHVRCLARHQLVHARAQSPEIRLEPAS